jgi:hypothetical protein
MKGFQFFLHEKGQEYYSAEREKDWAGSINFLSVFLIGSSLFPVSMISQW